MSSASWYKETDEKINYTKLCRLLVDGGTQALCSVFDGKYSPSSLRDFLNGNKETLQKLKKPKGKVLNDEQWGKLYPKNGSDGPQSKDFDITLLFVLLRNICGLTEPETKWDNLPLATDISLEANLARIKYYRNNTIAHKSNTETNDADFKQHWQDISSALQSLGLRQDDIDYLKSSPLGEKDYKQLLYDWYISDKDVKIQLEDVKSNTTDLKSDTADLKSDTADLKSDTTDLKSDTADIKSDTAVIKSDTTDLKSDTADLKSDTADIKSDLKSHATDIKSDLQIIKKHIQSGSLVSTSVRSRAELFEKQPFIEASLALVLQKVETVGLESAPTGPSDPSCQELVEYIESIDDLNTIDAETAAKDFERLQLDRSSMRDPPEDVVKKCRYLCSLIIKKGRKDIVEKMRKKLPSGITGPLLDESALYNEMASREKQEITRALCVKDLWQRLADEFKIPRNHLNYYDRLKNPVEELFEEVCRSRSLTIGELYDVLVKCGANALADNYL